MTLRIATSLLAIVLSCSSALAQPRLTDSVDPFIGTGGHGHTFPGPSLPFGMIQPGPDTRLTGWELGCIHMPSEAEKRRTVAESAPTDQTPER